MPDQPRIREILPAEAQQLIDAGAALIDTREVHEWKAGHLAGATLIPPIEVAGKIVQVVPERARPVVIYCAGGTRSLRAAFQLAQLGYRDVASVAGGITRWKAEGRPWQLPADTHPIATNPRYARHLVMPEVGPEGQGKLAQAKVLVIGAGGLGSPALLYLAAAGVGTIGIVDFDVVELSNLQRQVVHSEVRVGVKKTVSAAQTIKALNPEVKVVQHTEMLTDRNVDALIDGYDLVIDGTDTFETRYWLNDAAVRAAIPVVHASVFRFEGQLTVFVPYEGPCYRCLYPTPPPPELAPGREAWFFEHIKRLFSRRRKLMISGLRAIQKLCSACVSTSTVISRCALSSPAPAPNALSCDSISSCCCCRVCGLGGAAACSPPKPQFPASSAAHLRRNRVRSRSRPARSVCAEAMRPSASVSR